MANLKICSPCLASAVVLKVGPSGGPANCWVDLGPCSFNPDIAEIADPNALDLDCNNSGQADYLDILDGTSSDVDGNGVPDECQGCVGVAVAGGPLSASAGVGGTASFAVQAAGSGPFSYQWRKGGAALSGQTNSTLVLANLTLAAADLYDAVVTNACGQATSPSAVLQVDPRPALSIAQTGANVMLSWTVTGYHLQASPVLSSPAGFTNMAGASPVTVPINMEPRYFRLQQDD